MFYGFDSSITFSTRALSRFANLISAMTRRRAAPSVGGPASTLKVRTALICSQS